MHTLALSLLLSMSGVPPRGPVELSLAFAPGSLLSFSSPHGTPKHAPSVASTYEPQPTHTFRMAEHPWSLTGFIASIAGGVMAGGGAPFFVVGSTAPSVVGSSHENERVAGELLMSLGLVAIAAGVGMIVYQYLLLQ